MVQALQVATQWSVKFVAVHPKTGQRVTGNWKISGPSKTVLMRRLAIVYPEFELRSFQWKRQG